MGRFWAGTTCSGLSFLIRNQAEWFVVRRGQIQGSDVIYFRGQRAHFVIRHDLHLSLHATDGSVIKKLELNANDFPDYAYIKSSPSGKTLFVGRSHPQGERILRITASDLQEIGWFHSRGYFTEAPSDSHFVFLREHPSPPFSVGANGSIVPTPKPMDVFSFDISGSNSGAPETRRIYTTSEVEQHEDWAGTCLSLAFLDDETLAISGNCHKLTILHVSGKVLLQQQFPKELISAIIGCSGCDLVAGYTYVLKGGSS